MPKAKIAVSIDERILERVDEMVRRRVFGNRSQAFESAILEKIDRLDRTRLASECARLDPVEERELSEEGLSEESSQWPEY